MVVAGMNPKISMVEPELTRQTIAPSMSNDWPAVLTKRTRPGISLPCISNTAPEEFCTKSTLVKPKVEKLWMLSALPELFPTVPTNPFVNGTDRVF